MRVNGRDWFECYFKCCIVYCYCRLRCTLSGAFAVVSVMNTRSVMLQLNILLAYPRQLSIVRAFNIIPTLLSEFNSIEIGSRGYD